MQIMLVNFTNANDDGTYCTGCQGYVEETYTGDECGGVECTATTNPSGIPHPPGSHYAGSPYACFQGQTGITIHHFTQNCPSCPCCTPSCSCAASTYVGSNCGDGCGGSCAGQRRDGVCGTRAKIYEATDIAFSGTWCTYGADSFPNGVPVFPNPGQTTVSWTCDGVSGGNPVTNCQASRKFPSPTVNLKINGSDGPINPNRDNGENLDISWSVVPNAAGVTTYCNKAGSSWGGGQIIPGRSLIDIDNNVPLPVGAYPINNIPYVLSCYNGNGNPIYNSNTAQDTVFVNVYCTAGPDIWTDCSRECGTGSKSCTTETDRCVIQNCVPAVASCNTEPCPLSSEWTEVKP